MNTLKYLTISLLSVLLVFTACTSDGSETKKDKTITTDDLNGRWDLSEAVRDGQKTASLEGTYMEFGGNDQLSCNFNETGDDVESSFILKDNTLTHNEQNYKIESFSDSELVVSTKLMDFDFKLTFNKAE